MAGRTCDHTTPTPTPTKLQDYRKQQQQQQQQEEAEWAVNWVAPVFGVAAAAAIALYMGHFKETRRETIVMNKSESKDCKSNMKLRDMSLTSKNGILIKSRSSFV